MTTIKHTDNPTCCTWEHGEYTGTITFPANEGMPVRIEWDQAEVPHDWEDIEEQIVTAVSSS